LKKGATLFEYSSKQKTYTISNVKVGGEVGLVPTVMIGSIFYNGHIIVQDPIKGIFNKKIAESQIRRTEEVSDLTGLSTMFDLIAENSVAAENYLNFVFDISELPILLDVVDEKALIESLKYASEQEMIERIIINSLTPHTDDTVYETVKEVGCRNAILLLHSSKYMFSSNKNPVLDNMLPKVIESGIQNILVDTAVLDIPSLGLALKSINRIKDKYGYPSGCGAHNAVSSWKRLHEKYSIKAASIAIGVTSAFPIATGADFVFYGPIRNAETVYPSIAMIDAAYSQQIIEKRIRIMRNHPRYIIG
jgi:tetrahydromethanopterin S-methyltransferase subunit H